MRRVFGQALVPCRRVIPECISTLERLVEFVVDGNVLGIERGDVLQTLVAGTVALVAVAVLRRDLLVFCFDPNHARAIGLNTTFMYYVLLALLALAFAPRRVCGDSAAADGWRTSKGWRLRRRS